LTLFIKGTEGFLAGFIGNSKSFSRKLAGVVVAAIAMLAGYFLVETPLKGMGAALGELVAINSVQVIVGAVVSVALAQAVVRAYPEVEFFKPKRQSPRMSLVVVVLAAVILVAVVSIYLMAGISP
jgi:uncharacterized membrane protein